MLLQHIFVLSALLLGTFGEPGHKSSEVRYGSGHGAGYGKDSYGEKKTCSAPPTQAPFNNKAISYNQKTDPANYDSVVKGPGYSAMALLKAGWGPGKVITVNGYKFTLPYWGKGKSDNWIEGGQKVKVTSVPGATRLGFLVSSDMGNFGGKFKIVYTDCTTQVERVGATDWNWRIEVAPGNTIAIKGLAGTHGPKDLRVYAVEVDINPSKEIAYVEFPTVKEVYDIHPYKKGIKGHVHVFSLATKNVGYSTISHEEEKTCSAPPTQAPFNNKAVSYNQKTDPANYDSVVKGPGYSAMALLKAGWGPGKVITVNGYKFTLPYWGKGKSDNWIEGGQKVKVTSVPGATRLGFLVSSDMGNFGGKFKIVYTDCTTQVERVGATDWNWRIEVAPGNTIAIKGLAGTHGPKDLRIYAVEVNIDPSKEIAYVVFPTAKEVYNIHPVAKNIKGHVHVFALATKKIGY